MQRRVKFIAAQKGGDSYVQDVFLTVPPNFHYWKGKCSEHRDTLNFDDPLSVTEAGEPFVPRDFAYHGLQITDTWALGPITPAYVVKRGVVSGLIFHLINAFTHMVLCVKMLTKSVYGLGEWVYQYLILESNFKVGLLS